jgi:hypothetical protein
VQDKSFEEAMQELNSRTTAEMLDYVRSRSYAVAEDTVSSAVADIENDGIRAGVADVLCLNKTVVLLGSLTNMGLLKEAELQELTDYLNQLHSRAYPPKGKRNSEEE